AGRKSQSGTTEHAKWSPEGMTPWEQGGHLRVTKPDRVSPVVTAWSHDTREIRCGRCCSVSDGFVGPPSDLGFRLLSATRRHRMASPRPDSIIRRLVVRDHPAPRI